MLCNKKRKGVKKLAPKVQRSLGEFYGTKQLKLAVFGSALKKHYNSGHSIICSQQIIE